MQNTDRRENPITLRKKLYAVISRADARLLRKLLTFALRELHEEDDEGEQHMNNISREVLTTPNMCAMMVMPRHGKEP